MMQVVFKGAKVAGLLAVMALSGCRTEPPDRMQLSFGTYSTTPVIILEFTVNNQATNAGMPSVQQGNADISPIRASSGSYSGDWPGDPSTVQIDATWVELLTHRAYRAQIVADTSELPRSPSLGVMVGVTPIFGPHGLMILAGEEPVANPKPLDLAQVCGTRQLALDEDFTGDPLAHAGMTEALQIDYPPIATQTACPEPDA